MFLCIISIKEILPVIGPDFSRQEKKEKPEKMVTDQRNMREPEEFCLMEAKGKGNLGKRSLEISRRMRTEKRPSDLTVGTSNSS